MFATVEEAAKAAAMLRRFGGKEPTVSGDFVAGERCWKIDPGVGQPYLWDWEQVADYLLARREEPPQEDRPAGQLAEVVQELAVYVERLMRVTDGRESNQCPVCCRTVVGGEFGWGYEGHSETCVFGRAERLT